MHHVRVIFFCSIMRLILLVYCDKQIICVPREDVNLLDYHDFSIQDWKALPLQLEVQVKVMYDDEVYDACVLQVIPDDDIDVGDTLNMLRTAWNSHKLKKLSSLLSFCPTRVRETGQQKWLPLQVREELCIIIECESIDVHVLYILMGRRINC